MGVSGRRSLATHLDTGEPLSEEEKDAIVAAGVAKDEDFDDTGGGMYRHVSLDKE